MNITETSILLAKIQAFDNRNVADPTIIAWQEILEPHTLPDCLDAVRGYYRVSAEWIMPAHIVERVREVENRRVDGFKSGLHLNETDDRAALTTGGWQEANRRLWRAAATGELTPAMYAVYDDGTASLESVLGQAAIA